MWLCFFHPSSTTCHCRYVIRLSWTMYSNRSIASGCYPQAWKLARIVPIHKSGDKATPTNYRPISILSIVSKVLERHVHTVVSNFLAENAPISPCQWGFMSHLSATSALCSITHNWSQALDGGNEVCSIFFDIRKAFDSVPHVHLLDKLAALHLDPRIIAWLHSYLMGRSQLVVVGGEQSTCLPVISGVPQGSVLGPLLFIVYINDVATRISPYSRISLFADDMTLYRTIYVPADYNILQDDVTAISQWVDDNYLTLHTGKCCLMFVTRRHSLSNPPPPLYLGTSPLNQVNSVKYLGIMLTSDMSWSLQVTRVSTKVRKLTGLLYCRFYRYSSPGTLTKLYVTYIRPHFEYAAAVWDPYLIKDINLLEKTQRFALKVCAKNWSLSHDELLSHLQLPPLSERRSQAKLCHLFKIMHGLEDFPAAPVKLKELHYSTRSDNSQLLQPLYSRTSQFQHSFFPHAISLWNMLPGDSVSSSSLSSFKHSLL